MAGLPSGMSLNGAGSMHRREGWVDVEQLRVEQLMFERLRGRGVERFVKLK